MPPFTPERSPAMPLPQPPARQIWSQGAATPSGASQQRPEGDVGTEEAPTEPIHRPVDLNVLPHQQPSSCSIIRALHAKASASVSWQIVSENRSRVQLSGRAQLDLARFQDPRLRRQIQDRLMGGVPTTAGDC